MTAWTREIVDGVEFLYLDIPDKSQNVLGADVMSELERILDDMIETSSTSNPGGLVITSAKPGSFIAGADVTQIDRIDSPDDAKYKAAEGQRIFGKIERIRIPTVAAINGYCLGGGCELALACTYRIAALSPKVKIGLPETKLGILPGWGGTQRLPRIVGIANALDMILAGKLLDPKKALKIGLVDRVVAPDLLLSSAVAILKARPKPAKPRLKGLMKWLETPLLRRIIFQGARKESAKKTKGHYPAIPAVIDLMEETIADFGVDGAVRPEALAREAEAFGKLVITDVSRNLRHLFFLDDAQKKYAPYNAAEPRTVRGAGVLGAGIMGGGIAWAFSKTGVPVRVRDIREPALLGALSAADKVYRGELKRRRINEAELRNGMSRISVGLDYTGFARADIVVEAVVEKMEIKKAVLAEVENHVSPEAVIATNTSGLSINEMASVMKHPERFGGLHFFNPVDRMPLVEIIRGDRTGDGAVATLFAVARRMGKTPILVKDSPGFLVNRILIPYMLEAARMLGEGVAVDQIDRAAEAFGMPMGPLRLVDEIGMDIGLHVAKHLESAFGARMAVPEVFDTFIKQGLLGKKSGSGFYLHAPGKKGEPDVNPKVRELIAGSGASITDSTVSDRLGMVMLLEAVRCLEDRVVQRPEEIDIGMIYGTGFPPFRGGLIRWGTMLGYTNVLKRVGSFRELYGDRFDPPAMLRDILS